MSFTGRLLKSELPPLKRVVSRRRRKPLFSRRSPSPVSRKQSTFKAPTSSVEKILDRLNLKIRDLNSLDSDTIQTIFINFTIGEISLICSASHSFNTVCRRESLWKKKVFRDHGVIRKTGRTWRETARRAYLESLDRYWYDTLERDMEYYFIDPNSTEFSDIRNNYDSNDPNAVDPWDQIKQFERNFVKRALRDRKAISATKILFNAFYLSSRYIQDTEESFEETVETFMPIFRKAAEALPGGKIPLQWMLDEASDRAVKIREFDPAAWKVAIDDEKLGRPIIPLTQQDYTDYYKNRRLADYVYTIVAYKQEESYLTGKWETVRDSYRERWSDQDYHRHLSERKLMKQSYNNSLETYILPWNEANEDLYINMAPLAGLYRLHPELFVDDTKDGDSAEMGMVLMNYPGAIL